MGGKQNKRNESKIKIIRKGLEIFFVLSSLLFFSSFFLIFFKSEDEDTGCHESCLCVICVTNYHEQFCNLYYLSNYRNGQKSQ